MRRVAVGAAVLVAVGLSGACGADDQRDDERPEVGTAVQSASSMPARPTPTSLDDVAKIIAADGVKVLVLGDSTGDERGEWVDQWARALGERQHVTVSMWAPQQPRYGQQVEYGDASAGALHIWNGSRAGAVALDPLENLEAIAPEEPDVIVYNFAHNHVPGEGEAQMAGLDAALRERFGDVPAVVVAQNPATQDANRDKRGEVLQWAQDQGLPVIRVDEAFKAEGDYDALMSDGLHPNPEGSRVWALQVARDLSPDVAEALGK